MLPLLPADALRIFKEASTAALHLGSGTPHAAGTKAGASARAQEASLRSKFAGRVSNLLKRRGTCLGGLVLPDQTSTSKCAVGLGALAGQGCLRLQPVSTCGIQCPCRQASAGESLATRCMLHGLDIGCQKLGHWARHLMAAAFPRLFF